MNEAIWKFGDDVFTNGLLAFLIYCVFTYVVTKILIRLLKKILDQTYGVRKPNNAMALDYLFKTLKTVLIVIAVISVLSNITYFKSFGTTVIGATGIIAVVVSLAAQETFGNYISGFFLATQQPFKKGDFINLPTYNISGTVSDITLRHTEITTTLNTKLIIPNSVMNNAVIDNRSFGQDYCKSWIILSVAYNSDMELVKKVLREAVSSCKTVIDARTTVEKAEGIDPVPVMVSDFLDSGVEVKAAVFTRDYFSGFGACSEIRETILTKFRENGIEIPYPVRTVITRKE